MTAPMTAAKLLVLLMMASAMLSGCGRRGELDTPYQAAVQARKDAKANNEPVPPEPEKPVADKPFILDGLI